MSSLTPTKATKEDSMSISSKTCFLEECDKKVHGLSMCGTHYYRYIKNGSPLFAENTANKEKHSMYNTPTYRTWSAMRRRCRDIKDENYGGRGIKVCDRWQTLSGFINDMGERPIGMTLDRIDSDGNYEPSNCRWASPTQQSQNKRNNNDIPNIHWAKNVSKWCARKTVNGKRITLGYFSNKKDAINALSD